MYRWPSWRRLRRTKPAARPPVVLTIDAVVDNQVIEGLIE
jgi:hypothetical protein